MKKIIQILKKEKHFAVPVPLKTHQQLILRFDFEIKVCNADQNPQMGSEFLMKSDRGECTLRLKMMLLFFA